MDKLPGRRRLRNRTPEVEAIARQLRWNKTPAENVLWDALQGRKVANLRFRQQHAVGTFIFDFYCPECKLVVELDGGVHDSPDAKEQDAERDALTAAYGYHVLRFRNQEVLADLPAVLRRIEAVATPRRGQGRRVEE